MSTTSTIIAREETSTTPASDSLTDGHGVSTSIAIAAVLPSLFAVILLILIAVAFLMPRIAPIESPETKEERRQKRIERLNAVVGSVMFRDWRNSEIVRCPEAVVSVEPLCVICLEMIQEKDLVRGLMCRHVFHQQCLDGWYARLHEYCPLCHRPILPPTAIAGQHTDGHNTTPTTPQSESERAEPSEPPGTGNTAIAFMV